MSSGSRVQGSGFGVQGSGFGVQGSGLRVQGSGFRFQGSGFGGGGHLVGVFLDVDLDGHKLPFPAKTVRPLLRHLRRK